MTDLSSLAGRLGVSSVYWVDDENASSDQLDLAKLLSEVARKLVDEESPEVRKVAVGKVKANERTRDAGRRLDDILNLESDVDRAELIERELGKAFEDNRNVDAQEMLGSILSVLPMPLNPAQRDAVRHVFDDVTGCVFQQISFAEWGAQRATILGAHPQDTNGALLIVDLQNSMESSPIDGKSVLSDWADALTNNPSTTNIFAIALTSKFTVKDELRKARALTNELFEASPTPSLPVVGLSKERMQAEEEAPAVAIEMFTTALGRLRAFELHRSLSKTLGVEFSKATESAFETLQQLTAEELVYAVSTTSVNEGAPETETLIRLAAIAQRRALSEALRKKRSIREMLMELRGLQFDDGHSVSPEDLESTDGIQALRCSEINEDPTVINKSLSPVTTGDIFWVHRRGREPEFFVVVSNACDLMLRGGTGARNLSDVLLIRLDESTGEKSIRLFPSESELHGKQLEPRPIHTLVLPLDVLDLCWTNRSGKCTWRRAADAAWARDMALLPSQQKRFAVLNGIYSPIDGQNLRLITPDVRRTVKRSVDGEVFDALRFRIRRVGRFSFALANKIAREFAVNTSRHPADHDFTEMRAR